MAPKVTPDKVIDLTFHPAELTSGGKDALEKTIPGVLSGAGSALSTADDFKYKMLDYTTCAITHQFPY